MNDEVIRKICRICGQNKILILDFLVADRNREDIICKSCRNNKRKKSANSRAKYLTSNIGVKL